MDDAADGPALGPGAVAALLGVAATTLRSWDRRYGLGPGDRTEGGHRRYTPRDVERLRRMRRLTYSGVPAAEAAALALRDDPPVAVPGRPGPGPPGPGLPSAGRGVKRLARAAAALDGSGLLAEVRGRLAEHDARTVWTELLIPLLTGVGERWARTGGDGVEIEHLMSWCVSTALREHTTAMSDALTAGSPKDGSPRAGSPKDGDGWSSGRIVLLAAAPEEQHTLALEALAAVLAERGTRTGMLGARVPPTALGAAIARLSPTHVVVWAQTEATADAAALPSAGHAAVLLAGPGWTAPVPGLTRVGSLDQALNALDDLPDPY
jgi:DNA-binding transcriptional MerR regulator